MVQKYCPTCKDLIPVACKSCPCGHKFVKTVAESLKTEHPSSEQDSNLGREENGRPRRKSAMNSLYYHSSLHFSSYRIARHAAAVSARRKSPIKESSTEGAKSTENGSVSSTATANGQTPVKRRKRGRPRLTPLPESEADNAKAEEEEVKPKKEEEDFPTLRRRRPGLIYSTLRSPRDLYNHPPHPSESNAKSAKKAINDSESYGKLYQTLSEERKTHFALILSDINFKFKRNANFPL